MNAPEYVYRAVVTRVYDGDTVTADIDLGFDVHLRGQTLRLHGINAPELRGPEAREGLKSRDYLRAVVDGQPVILQSHKGRKGKYGRWLADLLVDGQNVNERMVEYGYAERY